MHRFGGGRPGVPDRRVLAAVFFVLRTRCRKALDGTGLGSGSTAHRRFQEWVGAGAFLHLACALICARAAEASGTAGAGR
jgi:hypothetical protein